MKDKWTLVVGVMLLSIGILLRIFSKLSFEPYLILVIGSGFKIYYITKLIKDNIYKPGVELLILVFGLILFFSGIYFRSLLNNTFYIYFLISGLIIKGFFIIVFIKKIKAK